MFTVYNWRGKPIHNIEKWAEERGEQMIKYRATRKVPSLLTGQIETEIEEGKMPESFWNGLLMSDGWRYEKL